MGQRRPRAAPTRQAPGRGRRPAQGQGASGAGKSDPGRGCRLISCTPSVSESVVMRTGSSLAALHQQARVESGSVPRRRHCVWVRDVTNCLDHGPLVGGQPLRERGPQAGEPVETYAARAVGRRETDEHPDSSGRRSSPSDRRFWTWRMRPHCILRMRSNPSVARQNVSRGPAGGSATAGRRA